jgi:hypothetical protein
MLRVSLETSDRGLALDAVRSFVARGYVRDRRLSRPLQWRVSVTAGRWHFEWIEEDDLESRSPLSSTDIERIRRLRGQGWKLLELATEFGVTVSAISRITAGVRRTAA